MSIAEKTPFERFLETRTAQAELPYFQKLVERDAKRGTRRDVYLLRERVFGVSGVVPKGLVGPRLKKPPEDRLWVTTPAGLVPASEWHQQQLEKAVNRRRKRNRRCNRAARATRKRQRRG